MFYLSLDVHYVQTCTWSLIKANTLYNTFVSDFVVDFAWLSLAFKCNSYLPPLFLLAVDGPHDWVPLLLLLFIPFEGSCLIIFVLLRLFLLHCADALLDCLYISIQFFVVKFTELWLPSLAFLLFLLHQWLLPKLRFLTEFAPFTH